MKDNPIFQKPRAFLLAESCLCLFGLCIMSLYLSHAIISGENHANTWQNKVDQALVKNSQYKKEIANNEQQKN
ncbi:hypothetical protein [Lapidilactobacillus mulanensis]|nr:hypothetical protein [Lapidilactobacillus mulanensis]